jgi:predicted AlkP superfamily phosphohydrolase/phosphomutase
LEKTIIIGIDGATFDLMGSWMDDGSLPALAEVRDGGASGVLTSTVPPFSAPAWTSAVTGVSPGRHSIYDFFRLDTYDYRMITSTYRRAPAIWNALDHMGRRSIIVDVPGTYPAEPINGVMITGLLTPCRSTDFIHPPDLRQELADLEIESWWDQLPLTVYSSYAPEKVLEILIDRVEARLKVFHRLMQDQEWDLTMVVLRGTDYIQHYLWGEKALIRRLYVRIDAFIRQLREDYPGATLVILSDHGFQPVERCFYVNNLLYDAGLLRTTQHPRLNRQYFSLGVGKRLGRFLSYLLPLEKVLRSDWAERLFTSVSANAGYIDFARTRAYCHSGTSRGIRINLRGREAQGVVTPRNYERVRRRVARLLQKVKDPETGKPIVRWVRWPEEVYGFRDDRSADLLFELERGYSAMELVMPTENVVDSFRHFDRQLGFAAPTDAYELSGDHAPEGVLLMRGERIRPGVRLQGARIVDVMPTVLQGMGLPLPEGLDGRVLEEAFLDGGRTSYFPLPARVVEGHSLSDREEKELRSRLQGLGYL